MSSSWKSSTTGNILILALKTECPGYLVPDWQLQKMPPIYGGEQSQVKVVWCLWDKLCPTYKCAFMVSKSKYLQQNWKQNCSVLVLIRGFKQRRRQQVSHTFAYLTTKNSCFARSFFVFTHFSVVLILSPTWNYLFCGCVNYLSTWQTIFPFFNPLGFKSVNTRLADSLFASQTN